jgi:ATP-dependent 26S proteasome regulatory subunit
MSIVGILADDADPMVSVMKVEKAPLESYADIGGLQDQVGFNSHFVYWGRSRRPTMCDKKNSRRLTSSCDVLFYRSFWSVCGADEHYQLIPAISPNPLMQIQEIKEAVELPLTHPELYEEIGIRPPKGVVLYGEPGANWRLFFRLIYNMAW